MTLLILITKSQLLVFNRHNTNKLVFEKANAIKNPDNKPDTNIETYETYVKKKQGALLTHTIRLKAYDPDNPLLI